SARPSRTSTSLRSSRSRACERRRRPGPRGSRKDLRFAAGRSRQPGVEKRLRAETGLPTGRVRQFSPDSTRPPQRTLNHSCLETFHVTGVLRLFRSAVVLILVLSVTSPAGDAARAAAAGPCGPPVVNAIACENSRTGDPKSEWDVVAGGDASIQGFATDISVNRGATVFFKVNTAAAAYRLDIYRLGYYAGLGARRVATVNPSVALPQTQPACLSQPATGLIDCGNWNVSASWPIPADAVSGIYIARLVRTDTGGANHIVFVVRDDAGTSDLLFQTSDTTWQAYNSYGGNSLYVGSPAGRAYKVSYNRPFNDRTSSGTPRNFLFDSEYPMLRWLEANGYDVSYSTGVDTDR